MTHSLIDRVRERLAAENAPLRPAVVAAAIRAESGGVLGDTEVLSALRVLETELTGAGVLEPLLRADGTTDLLVTSPSDVWVDNGNGLRRSDVHFPDEAAVRRLAQRLAAAAGRRLDDAQPWVDGQLIGVGGSRFTVRLHAVLPPVAADGTCLSLRVLRPADQDLAALTASGAIGPEARRLLDGIIAARLAFLVSGGTGAGKTTLLSAALGAVPGRERIICVEDAPELAPRHPHLVRLVARSANVEGAGEITLRQLVRQALRMRPDRIVVGGIDRRSQDVQAELYRDFADTPILRTSNATAEFIKYGSNALLATLISFSNEIANLCATVPGVDAAEVFDVVV